MSEPGKVFLARRDSPIHVGMGVLSAVVGGPILPAGYALFQYSKYTNYDSSCNVFVQGVEYGVGYMLGQFLFNQLMNQ